MIECCPECGVKILVWANEANVGRLVKATCPQCKHEWTCDLLAKREFSDIKEREKSFNRPREIDLSEGDIVDQDVADLYNEQIIRTENVHYEFEMGILEDDLSNRYYTTYGISSGQTDHKELKALYNECGDGIKHDCDMHAPRHQFTKGLEKQEKVITHKEHTTYKGKPVKKKKRKK